MLKCPVFMLLGNKTLHRELEQMCLNLRGQDIVQYVSQKSHDYSGLQ